MKKKLAVRIIVWLMIIALVVSILAGVIYTALI